MNGPFILSLFSKLASGFKVSSTAMIFTVALQYKITRIQRQNCDDIDDQNQRNLLYRLYIKVQVHVP